MLKQKGFDSDYSYLKYQNVIILLYPNINNMTKGTIKIIYQLTGDAI